MALISCPECRTETSTLGEACTKCGCPIAKMAIVPGLVPALRVTAAGAGTAAGEAKAGLDARIRAGLRWMLYLPVGFFAGLLMPTVGMSIGGWMLGDWTIPSAALVFAGYAAVPYAMVAIALNTAPVESDAGAAAVKWMMVGVAAFVALGTCIDRYSGDYGVVVHLQAIFGSLSQKACATIAACGLVAGVLGSIATDPEDML